MLQSGMTVPVHRHPPPGHVVVDLTFTLLPALGPKPQLQRGVRSAGGQRSTDAGGAACSRSTHPQRSLHRHTEIDASAQKCE
jgi:hypothetical protein